MPRYDEDDDLPDPSEYHLLPPRYPGTWNVWTTTGKRKLDETYSGRASQKQILTNEIGDYADLVSRELRKKIVAAVTGKKIREIPDVVHPMVCPECGGPQREHTIIQPSLFGD